MKCERLISLVKNWYMKVQEEAMAPARMVAFMEKHISQCEVCLADPDVKREAEKIREIVLPPSKVPKQKVIRVAREEAEEEEEYEEEEESSGDDDEDEDYDSDDEDSEDDDENYDDDDELIDDDDDEI